MDPGIYKKDINMDRSHRKINLLACGLSMLLLLYGIACVILLQSAVRPGHEMETVLIYGLCILAAALLSFVFMKLLPFPVIIKGALPFYVFVAFMLLISSRLVKYNWIIIGSTEAYLSSLMGLLYFGIAWSVSKYREYKLSHMWLPLLLMIGIPFIIFCFTRFSYTLFFELFLSNLLFILFLIQEKRVTHKLSTLAKIYLILTAIMFCTAPLWCSYLIKSEIINDQMNEIRQAISSAKFIGISEYMINDLPAYQHYAGFGFAYEFITVLLRYGWGLCIFMFLAGGCLCYLIYHQSNAAPNSYARHFAQAVCAFQIIRIVWAFSQYFLSAWGYFPYLFTGDLFNVIADVILIISVFVLCSRKDTVEEGLIDQERSYGTMLDALGEQMKERLREMTGLLEPYEGDFDFDDDNEFDFDDDSDEDYEGEYLEIKKTPEYSGKIIEASRFESARLKRQIRELQVQIKELEKDKENLNADKRRLLEISKKYAPEITDSLAPEKYERDLIFISYSSVDSKIARQLSDELEKRGETTWYYERDLTHGSYPKKIIQALKRSAVFVVIISKDSNDSEEVFNEVSNACSMLRDGLIIMPIVIDDIILSENLQYYLGRHEQTHAYERPLGPALESFSEKVIFASTRS